MIESYERNFLIYLLIASSVVLGWLFYPFLPSLFFALILSSSTAIGYKKLVERGHKPMASASIMVALLGFVIVVPFSYLMIEAIVQINNLYGYLNNSDILKMDHASLATWLASFGVTDEYFAYIKKFVDGNVGTILNSVKNVTLTLSKNVFGNTFGFFTFIILTLFILFFFYVDGERVIKNLKIISPLNDKLDEKIFSKFAYMSSILTITVFSIALLQGVSFGLIMGVLGLPILITAVLIAVTSFIPIVGSFLVWFPIAIYFGIEGMWIKMIITAVWGGVVNGIIIDNILRPIIVKKISKFLDPENDKKDEFNPLDHTMILVLSTLAGLAKFGVLGLFTGPIIAALSITIFEMYRDYVSPEVKQNEKKESECEENQ